VSSHPRRPRRWLLLLAALLPAGVLAGACSSSTSNGSSTGSVVTTTGTTSAGPSTTSTGAGGGAGGSSTTSTTSTTSAGGAGGGGGSTACDPDGGGPAETPCTTAHDCTCPASCQGGFCVSGCNTSADCPATSACVQQACVFVGCGPDADGGANGAYGGPCNASGTNDGTCFAADGFGCSPQCPVGWLCVPAGTATTACTTITASPSNPPAAQSCAPGTVCVSSDGGPSGSCEAICGASPASGGCPPAGVELCMNDGGDAG
jgi:hypothetical protein